MRAHKRGSNQRTHRDGSGVGTLGGTLAVFSTAITLATGSACSDAVPAGPSVAVETIGDTTIVRTLSGSVWGTEARLVPEVSIGDLEGPDEYLFGRIGSLAVDEARNVYVFDTQSQQVRVFDAAGAYVETLGRDGQGPGEFARAETIAVLPDGRVLVRDPGNMRVQVFDRAAGRTEEWEYNSGNSYRQGAPLYTDVLGRTFLVTSDGSRDDIIIILGVDGAHLDTLPGPTMDYERFVVSAEHTTERGTSSVASVVPFTPRFFWAVHSSGQFLTGLSSDYRIDLARDDGVLRIERAYDPVPVSDAERAYRRESTVRMIRFTAPDWTWDGPAIPEHKPVFTELLSGRGGRIWVRLLTEGQRVENEDHDPENPFSEAVTWRESTRYDVFEADGTYLGAVVPPDDFSTSPDPVFAGDHVWAVARDELGVERVIRYRIEVGVGGGGRPSPDSNLATTFDTIAGVVHVANNGTPPAWRLVPVVSIGPKTLADEGGPEEFGRVTAVALGPDGNVFVADTRNHEVRVFGLDGSHRRTFGREGEGPGEFRSIYSIAWVGDRLLTFDPPLGRLGEFSADGEWLGQRRTEAAGLTGSPADIRLYPVGANEVFRFALGSALDSGAGVVWVGYRSAGETGDTVARPTPDPPEGVDLGIFCEAESAIGYFPNRFSPQFVQHPASGGVRYSAWSGSYRIVATGAAGDTLRVIERAMSTEPVSDGEWATVTEEYDEFRERFPNASCRPRTFERPDRKPLIQQVFIAPDGKLWVEVIRTAGNRWELFDTEGRLLGSVPAAAYKDRSVPVFRGDYIATIRQDELELDHVDVWRLERAR